MPHERHGDDRHLILEDLEAAAQANGNSLKATWETMQDTMAGQVGRPEGERAQAGQRP
jgi:hypothetical protein